MSINKIAIINDSNTPEWLPSAILEKTNHLELVSSDGYLGLISIAKHKPDIAIIDANTPTINGMDLTRIIKSNPEFTLPIVLLTAQNTLFGIQHTRVVGADYYLTKPFSPGSLLEAVFDVSHG